MRSGSSEPPTATRPFSSARSGSKGLRTRCHQGCTVLVYGPTVKIAALDVGTNSIHLLIARVGSDGQVEPLDRAKEMVRLGDSAFKGVIAPDAFARATECIRRFRAQAERAGVDAIIAVATSAVREAENGGDFVRVVRDETGIELTVIRGEQEARLIYLGARAALNLAGRKALIIDIG